MIKNVGRVDQLVRLIVSAVLVILFFTGYLSGVWGYIGLAAAVIFTATAFMNFCPIWWACKINTQPKQN